MSEYRDEIFTSPKWNNSLYISKKLGLIEMRNKITLLKDVQILFNMHKNEIEQ